MFEGQQGGQESGAECVEYGRSRGQRSVEQRRGVVWLWVTMGEQAAQGKYRSPETRALVGEGRQGWTRVVHRRE